MARHVAPRRAGAALGAAGAGEGGLFRQQFPEPFFRGGLSTSTIRRPCLVPGTAAIVNIVIGSRDDVLRAPNEAPDFVSQNIAPAPALPRGQGRVRAFHGGKPSPIIVNLGLDDGPYSEMLEAM